jgi:branched-chain amino acid aminotransferase
MAESILYVNGAFVPESEAKISVMDHGVLYGDGVFETAFARNGSIFKLDAHIERGFRSMLAIALQPPVTPEQLKELVVETVRRNGLRDAYIKWVVTRGYNGKPLLDPAGCQPSLIILALPYIERATKERIEQGLRLKTVAVRRPSGDVLDARIKSLNYLNLVLAKLEAKAAGVDEALLLDAQGRIAEATGCNILVVRGGRLLTPGRNILLGVTRETVIELAQEAGIPVEVCDLELFDAYTADEILICSTAGGLLPVSMVDGRVIGAGKPGPMFQKLQSAYRVLTESGRHGTPIAEVRAA